MLKKMRWRFVLSAMAAVFTVMAVLVAAINSVVCIAVTKRQDQTLESIQRFEIDTPPHDIVPIPGGEWFNAPSPESRYSTRFFSVQCDSDGNVLSVKTEYIASVSETEAAQYAADILKKGSSSGYLGEYRYAVMRSADIITLVFLNSANELQLIEYMLIISCSVALATLLLIFGLVILLSKRAILPYVKNLEMQKQFITDAGHELKTPITSIATSADVLEAEHEGDEWVANIRKQCMRLTKLVNNLVTLSRLDEAVPFPEKVCFSLSEAAWEAAEPFSSLASACSKSFSQRIEDEITINGDKNAIQQVISILLDNALRYSDSGGQIQFDVYKKNSRVFIEVFNTCEHLNPEDISHLFDRFYRPDKSRSENTGGTGIGLSIAKAAVQGHGGKISVHSPSGNSIRFTVALK